MSAYRFNPPPGWPVPPVGWTPPADWRPDPAWPAAPEGWQLWVPEGGGPETGALAVGAAPVVPAPRKGRSFGRRRADAVSEAEELRAWIARTQGLDAERVADLVRQVEAEARGAAGEGGRRGR
ncbi:hypothetical protein QHG49_18350 [Streptomyces sp. WP-1]|nr:hypothetical protein [Streptomyces sp. WP-1]WKE70855.1 hypothetical protein QHG49_18350 [Streptomyces sp. WP-1]